MRKMHLQPGALSKFSLVIIALVGLPITGCNNSSSVSSENNKSTELPKFDFHKPKTLSLAVNRMRQLHDAITSNEQLPAPVKYGVREVIHGEGANAHSHYYHADAERKEMDDHGHEPMKEEEKSHQIEIDVFTEFHDIARWLPKIAAATDGVEAETFNSVSNVATELLELSKESMQADSNESERRKSFRASTELNGLIEKLESALSQVPAGTGKERS